MEKQYILVPILFLVLSVCSMVYAGVGNPLGLVTDEELEKTWPEIESFWLSGTLGSFKGEDAIEIVYRIFLHPREAGAVVISSGRTESFIKYKEVVYNLGQLGYSIYIHDHRGQGFSGRMAKDSQKGHVWDFNDYVLDLKTFYDLKVAPGKHKNLFLLAHSMGGGIATRYIEKYPTDFKAAALSSPMHQPDTGIHMGLACKGAGFTTWIRDIFISLFGWEPRYALGQGPHEPKTFTPDNPKIMTHSRQRFEIIQKLYDENSQVKIGGITSHWLAAACKASKKMIEDAALIKIPVLVIQAGEDIAVKAQGQNIFCDNLALGGETNCDGGKPFLIKNGYHELFIESDEYRLPALTRIIQFFQKHSLQ